MIKNFLFSLILLTSYFPNLYMAADTKQDPNIKIQLVQAAIRASEGAYAPYSKYKVGAALLTKDGKIISGSNVENASYGLFSCAERNTGFKAVTDGMRDFSMIAVVTKDGGAPCGACRQVLNEFNPNLTIIIANAKGKIIRETNLSALLPEAFGSGDLGARSSQ